MKKILLSLAVIASLFMASCGDNKADQQATETIEQVKQAATEADAQNIIDKAVEYAKSLVTEGKVAEAKEYLDQIAPVVKDKFPALATYVDQAQNFVAAAADKVAGAQDAVEGAKEAASDAVDQAQDAVSDAADAAAAKVDEAKDAVADKAQEVKDAAAEKVQDVKDGAANAVQQGADAVKGLIK